MIQEDYVSFEVAKLLKEKGFDEKCSRWYVANEPQEGLVASGFGENQFYINAPTHQMAMKWLREVHNIFIEINTSIDLNGKYHFSYTILDKECKYVVKVCRDPNWNYEEAAEVAIKYCLENLI